MPEAFESFRSQCLPLNVDNIDTDQIIPARFLKGTTRSGLGKNLFNDWRYLNDESPNPDFVLNNPRYSGKILVAGDNFGCGSSREHAPWALTDYGFRAIISSSFADIFKNNALKNNLLPIALEPATVKSLLKQIEAKPTLELRIDLEKQEVISDPKNASKERFSFEIDPFRKQCLLEGSDDIGYTLAHLNDIKAYEAAKEKSTTLT